MSHTPVAIIGAGLAGLSAAFHLRRAGVSCRVFEREPRPGGHAVTDEELGYRFDRTGHLLHVADRDLLALALEWIGPDHRWIDRDSRVWSHGVYTRYPFQANAHGLPAEVAFECVSGFIAAARARDRGDVPAPRDFEQFCRLHFGDAISDRFMIPYNSKLWGVAPQTITAAWCERFVPIPSVDDVVAGAVGIDKKLGYNARFVYPTRGIGELSNGLARAVGDVELGAPVRAIDMGRSELEVAHGDRRETVTYDALVATLPLPMLVAMTRDAPEDVKAAARKLRCTHLYYLDVALRREPGVPHHWIYVPEPQYPFYRVGCYSSFSPAMAPAGCGSLYVELADRDEPQLSSLMPQVTTALAEMGIIAGGDDIAFVRKRRIDWAYVIFDHDHFPALEVVHGFLDRHRVRATGRYGGWNYSSMGDALRFGRDAAQWAAR